MTPPTFQRMARCSYYGRPIKPAGTPYGSECSTCNDEPSGTCRCERPSSPDLAFFQARDGREHDAYYCGCHSWE